MFGSRGGKTPALALVFWFVSFVFVTSYRGLGLLFRCCTFPEAVAPVAASLGLVLCVDVLLTVFYFIVLYILILTNVFLLVADRPGVGREGEVATKWWR